MPWHLSLCRVSQLPMSSSHCYGIVFLNVWIFTLELGKLYTNEWRLRAIDRWRNWNSWFCKCKTFCSTAFLSWLNDILVENIFFDVRIVSFLQVVVKLPIIFMYCLWPTIQTVQLTCVFRFDEGMCFLLWWILIAFLSVGFLCKSWIFKMVNNKTSIQRLANECLFIWISASQSPDVAISAAVERNNELLTLKFIKVYAMPNPFGIGIRNAFGDDIGNPLTYETIPVTY